MTLQNQIPCLEWDRDKVVIKVNGVHPVSADHILHYPCPIILASLFPGSKCGYLRIQGNQLGCWRVIWSGAMEERVYIECGPVRFIHAWNSISRLCVSVIMNSGRS